MQIFYSFQWSHHFCLSPGSQLTPIYFDAILFIFFLYKVSYNIYKVSKTLVTQHLTVSTLSNELLLGRRIK